MDKSTSTYLDICRFLAALTVVFHHFFNPPLYHGDFRVNLGREAVIIFFVISGFVIAYVTDQKEFDGRVYCANRASRLYSVVLPALLLTLVCDAIVGTLMPAFYQPLLHNHMVVRFFGSLLFLNQLWNLTMAAFSNGPFWSLCYEFWYYVIFGLLTFAPKRLRVPLALFAALVAGPRIVLLLPVWLTGVAAYHLQKHVRHRFGLAILFVTASCAFMLIACDKVIFISTLVQHVKFALVDGYLFRFSAIPIFLGEDANFPADYALAVTFALTLISAKSLFKSIADHSSLSKLIRYCASYTFSMYMFHVPLLLLYAALLANVQSDLTRHLLTLLLTLTTVWILGSVTEQRREGYRTFFTRLLRKKIPLPAA